MNQTKRARHANDEPVKQQKNKSPDSSAAAVDVQSVIGLLNEIGPVRFVHLANGRFQVLYPELGGTEFPPDQEAEARELFQSAVRREKLGAKASGFDPCAVTKLPESNARDQGESFNARAVRKLCKDDILLSDFLDCCVIEMPRLLAFIDQAEGDEKEKTRIKQRLLRFQASERLREVSK